MLRMEWWRRAKEAESKRDINYEYMGIYPEKWKKGRRLSINELRQLDEMRRKEWEVEDGIVDQGERESEREREWGGREGGRERRRHEEANVYRWV